MLFTLTRPTDDEIRALVAAQRGLRHTYDDVGATRAAPPKSFDADHNRTLLGKGDAVFEAAKEAVRRWKMFDLGWLDLVPPDAIRPGECAVMVTRTYGLWSANVARISSTR